MSADQFTIQEERRRELLTKPFTYLLIWQLLDDFCTAHDANYREFRETESLNKDSYCENSARIHQYFISEILKAAQE